MTNANIDGSSPISSISWLFIPFARPLPPCSPSPIALYRLETRKARAINARTHTRACTRVPLSIHEREKMRVRAHLALLCASRRIATLLSILAAFIISALCLRLWLRSCRDSRFRASSICVHLPRSLSFVENYERGKRSLEPNRN